MAAPCPVGRFTLSVVVLALLATCDSGSGPSASGDGTVRLDVPVTAEALQATTSDSRLCCCRVVGTVVNHSIVPVHVTLKYEAYRVGQEDPAGTAVVFIRALQVGEQRSFSASGFVIPCSSIDSFVRVETNLRGVYFPE